MSRVSRQFIDEDASNVEANLALSIGINGSSNSGKTFSALRLATGIQRVVGGDIHGIDTEAKRMLNYKPYFKFRWVDFQAPFGALDYRDAIDHCVSQGAKIIIIDSMTHEHDGPGGLLDQMERFMDERAGNDYKKRDRLKFTAQIKPKRERVELRQRIVELSDIVFIFCYQAAEKIKPKAGAEPDILGWQPITTSTLHRDMTVRFLLTPGCEGVPTLMPEIGAERILVKNPEQFKGWFKPGEPLSEDMGQRMAEWSRSKVRGPKPIPVDLAALTTAYTACETQPAFDELEKRRGDLWAKIPPGDAKNALKAASDAAKKRVAASNSV